MTSRSPPHGCKFLATFSLLVGVGGLIRGFDGDVGSLIIGVVHLPAAYGLWTGMFWGWYVGLAAYSIGGIRGFWELQTNLLGGVISILFAIFVIRYLYSKQPHFLDDTDPVITKETINDLIE
jgi:uncharacterized membrane protein